MLAGDQSALGKQRGLAGHLLSLPVHADHALATQALEEVLVRET